MKLFSNLKIWIIAALVIVLAGALMVSIFGLNQTPDYKTAYEVSVSVDQNVKGSGDIADSTAKAYFSEKGYKYSSYATQKTADGSTYIYKFNNAGNISETELEDKITVAFNANADLSGLGLVAKAEYKQTATTADTNVGKIILACALGLLATFIIAFFIVKAASALTIVCNAVIAAVIYIMILAVTRIPALPDFVIGGAVSMILSVLMTFVITCRYKEKLKADEKADIKSVAENGVTCGAARLCFIACAGAIAAVALSATGSAYFIFTGLKVLIASVSAYITSRVATPALWTLFKGKRSNG